MGAFTDLSDVINNATGGGAAQPQLSFVLKVGRVASAAAQAPIVGQWTSLWQYGGVPGVGGSNPGAVAVCDRTTSGAAPLTNPGGGRQLWLTSLAATLTGAGGLLLYDRLLQIGGLSATTITDQNVQSGSGVSINRYTTGVGNQIGIEIYTQIGTTATTITASYTNQAGTAGRTTQAVTFGGTNAREAQRVVFLPLADGDTGVRSVETVRVLASTATAGNFGVFIAHPLRTVSLGFDGSGREDFLTGTPPPEEIISEACLAYAVMAASTNALNGEILAGIQER